jgi:hypothetical protein
VDQRRCRRGLARCLVGAGMLVALLLTLSAPAAAHGGEGAIYSGAAGPYTVYAFDGSPGPRPGVIRYDVIVWESASGQPVDEANVTVTARLTAPGDGDARQVGPVRARGVANVYQYTLPDPGQAKWRTQVTVNAASGTGTTQAFLLHGLREPVAANQAAQSSGPSPQLVSSIMIGVVVAMLVFTLLVYRRGSARARSTSRGTPSQ